MLNTQIFKATSTKLAPFLLALWPEERVWVDHLIGSTLLRSICNKYLYDRRSQPGSTLLETQVDPPRGIGIPM